MINNTVSNSKGFGGGSGRGRLNPLLLAPKAPGFAPQTPNLKITSGGAGFGGQTNAGNIIAPAAKPPVKGVISVKKANTNNNQQNLNANKTPSSGSLLNVANPIYQKNPLWMRPGETQAEYNARVSKLSGAGGTGGGSDNTQNNAGTPPPPANTNTNSSASQNFPSLVKTVSNMAAQPTAAFTQAQNTANQALQQLEQSRMNEAQALSANAQNAIPLEFQQGRAQVLQTQYQQQQNALAQQYSGAIAAEQAATGQQQTQLGGAEAAVTATTPQLGQYGQAYYQPLSAGATGASAGVAPTDPFYQVLQSYAQDLVNNQPGAVPSSISGNSVLWNQVLQMAQKINPNFNYNASVAGGAAQQSNIQTGGTASTTANQNIYNTALSNLANYQNMASNIKSFGDQLLNNMNTAGINPLLSQYANMTLNQLQTQFSSTGYATFNTNIQGLQARVSDLLNTGEIPSSATAGAQAIVNGNINLNAMEATLNQVNNEANAIVQNQASIAKNAYSNIQANTGTGTGGGNAGIKEGTTESVGGYNFVYKNGQWVTQ